MKTLVQGFVLCLVFAAGWQIGEVSALTAEPTYPAIIDGVVELRTYTAAEGKLDALHARFRDHTLRLFERHGIVNVGYWVPQDGDRSQNTIVFMIAHPSRDQAIENWEAFRGDPEWIRARVASEVDGPIVEHQESVFMEPTDYSPKRAALPSVGN